MKKLLKCRNGKQMTLPVFLIFGVFLFLFTGCDRDFVAPGEAPLQIRFDWTYADASEDIPDKIRLLLYDKDGVFLSERDIPSRGETIYLKGGVYRAICVNLNDHVELQDKQSTNTVKLVAKPSASSPSLTPGVSQSSVFESGLIYTYYIAGIEVDDVLLEDGRPVGEVETQSVTFSMRRIVQKVQFNFTVSGFSSGLLKSAVGKLDNVGSTVTLINRQMVPGNPGTCLFEPTLQRDGTWRGTAWIFGNEALGNLRRNMFELELRLQAGGTAKAQSDLTDYLRMTGGSDARFDAVMRGTVMNGTLTFSLDWQN